MGSGAFLMLEFGHFSHGGFPRPFKIALPRTLDSHVLKLRSSQDIEKEDMKPSFQEGRVSEILS